ncbi:hypothetical protein OLZ32_08085 [Rhizobium sp. 1AS11]|uniref:hypothetical protein n=1 Tax=Rhizobium acaciae TaxID=2989736 RepID=UPI0022231A94|nr:hypothetical protein [Rhizobium acaciae]MCW1408218.1 hypothetical protein [Rhizobium acaciae]MCW1740369.1 hypothetical protein [Rhizobium acaciae]
MTRPIIQGPYRTFRRLNAGESYLEFEGSTITIPMKARQSPRAAWMEEEIKLNAFMRLEVFPTYLNNLLTREFQFIIRDWYLYGKSVMLNRLFFNDPRGFWSAKYNDYVPATVTFRVSNNYDVSIFGDVGLTTSELFASPREIELRNLTSHHLRTWVEFPELDEDRTYTFPRSSINWQILLSDVLKSSGLEDSEEFKNAKALIVFHKKPVSLGDDGSASDDFDINDARARADYLLGVGAIIPDRRRRGGIEIRAVPLTRYGLNAMRVQLGGNTVLSPLYRPRDPLDIRWGLASSLDFGKLLKTVGGQKSKTISGVIRIVSPSRSLGTADQRPEPGDPADCADFPARITYAINYDITVNKVAFVEDQAGIAIAVGAQEIPPRDVTVAFDKPHLGYVLQQFLEFGPGHCTGMHDITAEQFKEGANFSRYWSTVPLDPTDPDWAGFEDYDPSKEY